MASRVKPTAICFFAGAGGCSLGFKLAGFDIRLANDIDRDSAESYAANHKGVPFLREDINVLPSRAIREKSGLDDSPLDIIVGGPPCQGFSSAGMRDGTDPRNQLVQSYGRVVRELRPRWFIMENVEGMLTLQHGEYVHRLVSTLLEAGYTIRIAKLDTADYGLPQRRKRVFVVGNCLGLDFDFPEPTHWVEDRPLFSPEPELVTLHDAIVDLPQATDDVAPLRRIAQPASAIQKRLSRAIIYNHVANCPVGVTLERVRRLKQGQDMRHLPPELQHESYRRRAFRRVMDGIPTEKRGGAPAGLRRLVYDEPCKTITSGAPREFVHPTENRFLTVRECARVQTFPDNYRFVGNLASQYRQVGNAVPPMMAEIIATHLGKCIESSRELQPTDEAGRWLGILATKSNGMSPALDKAVQLLNSNGH
ncbi:MAG: DNA cytosine methyltransferase [Planctomycetes bacterium]|nr:DNA cytosine methyltransferase [Planctomycetota bacterium]